MDKIREKVRITIFGVAGYNLGDDAMAVAAERALRSLLPQASITVASINLGRLVGEYKMEEVHVNRRSALGYLRIAKQISWSDVILIGGGTLIQDRLGASYVGGILGYILSVIVLSKLFGKPVLTLPIGVDKLVTEVGRRVARYILSNVDDLILRDPESLYRAQAIAPLRREPTLLGRDPAFLIDLQDVGRPAHCAPPYLVVSLVSENLRSSNFVRAIVEFVQHWAGVEPKRQVRLLAMDIRRDDELKLYSTILPEIRATVGNRVKVCAPTNSFAALELIANADLMIAMRLHAMILGVGYVPIVGISRSEKTESICKEFFIPHFSAAEAIVVDDIGKAAQMSTEPERIRQQMLLRLEAQDAARASLSRIAGMIATHVK